jgi:hypothetical protein
MELDVLFGHVVSLIRVALRRKGASGAVALREEEQEERFHDYGAIGWCATLTQLRRLR